MANPYSYMTTLETMSPPVRQFFKAVSAAATKLGIKELTVGVQDPPPPATRDNPKPKPGGILILASRDALADPAFRLALSAKFDLGGDGDDTAWPGS